MHSGQRCQRLVCLALDETAVGTGVGKALSSQSGLDGGVKFGREKLGVVATFARSDLDCSHTGHGVLLVSLAYFAQLSPDFVGR